MADKSIVIIGAGLAGLSAGCYAQMNGYRSQIFEHHTTPGGVAACWKRTGHLIGGGIHFLMSHKPGSSAYELYRQLGIAQASRVVDLITYGRFIDEASGRSVVVTQELDRLADELKAMSPADARAIDDLIAGAHALHHLAIHSESQRGLNRLAADGRCDHDPGDQDAAWLGQLPHGWSVGDTRRRCLSMPLFRPPCSADSLPPRRKALYNDDPLEHLQRLTTLRGSSRRPGMWRISPQVAGGD